MKKSLLGHLFSHIRGSAEDVATMSLQYLLTYYEVLGDCFNDLLSELFNCSVGKIITYECQLTGEELERPDMSGKDADGNEIILCEAKFYAGLTSNQPLTYLERLRKENGKGLVFICPKDRAISLWDTLLDKCKEQDIQKVNEFCVSVSGTNMAIVSWEEILSKMTRVADVHDKSALADIEQLRGYCEQMVKSAFVPFKEGELGADFAKRIEQLLYVLDRTIDAILADEEVDANVNGLRPTPHRHGYRRYFKINGLPTDLCLNFGLWEDDKYIDTPFWISFRNEKWLTPKLYNDCFSTIPATRRATQKGDSRSYAKGDIYLAIDVPCGVVEDDVIEGIKRQIYDYLHMIENYEGNEQKE